MDELENNLQRLRQVAFDGLMVLGFGARIYDVARSRITAVSHKVDRSK